jgi:alkylated DNA nucleotide flippase Atl1
MAKHAKPQGIAHRERLRALIVPRLAPGMRLPRTRVVGRWLGICQQEAHRHMRQVLAEAGVATETRGGPRRVYVTHIGGGAAA